MLTVVSIEIDFNDRSKSNSSASSKLDKFKSIESAVSVSPIFSDSIGVSLSAPKSILIVIILIQKVCPSVLGVRLGVTSVGLLTTWFLH